jgi:hypothetical protein
MLQTVEGMTHMITTWAVQLASGERKIVTTLDEARDLLTAHPGSNCEPVVRYTPCPTHPAYEPSNCPLCGSAPTIGV